VIVEGLLASKGYKFTSLSDIAKAANINIYHKQ